ncbi:MAG: hypothetical protein ACOXZU_07720 [Bacteroidales bacterium]|jgi:predicted glycosyltransferase
MNIAFYFAHPSQYYVFKHIIKLLKQKNYEIFIFIKSKDILEDLLICDGLDYTNLNPEEKKQGIAGLFSSVIKRNTLLCSYIKTKGIELLVTAASDSSQASFISGIPSIILNDDDAQVIRKSFFFGWPFSSVILAPSACNMGWFSRKTIFYYGYQKLGYLHPKYFKPDHNIIKKYGLAEVRYFLLRIVNLTAHHDKKIRGLNIDLVERLVNYLSQHGKVLISSEKELPANLQQYRLIINPLDIHHVLYYSSLLVGDSQSMAHEAALLGTPSVRFNDFVGRIGVLNELENKYKLTFGISPDNPGLLMRKVKELMTYSDNAIFKVRASEMMAEMIDLPYFVTWFIENYPESKKIMMENPDIQFNFK